MLGGPRAALGLLTILPVGPTDPRRAAPWFPLAGAVVGIPAAAVLWLLEPATGSAHAAVVALVVSVVLAGALHHDGLADTADGLGPRDRERRLAAMRDPGLGAFGALALIAWALLAVTALAQLDRDDAAAALLAAHVLARWAPLPQLAWVAPARADGLGATYAARPAQVAFAFVLAAALALAAVGPGDAAAAAAAALAGATATALVAGRAFGGRTGDTSGAAVLVCEVLVLGVLAALG